MLRLQFTGRVAARAQRLGNAKTIAIVAIFSVVAIIAGFRFVKPSRQSNTTADTVSRSVQENSLLVSQQLDELFRTIESVVMDHPEEMRTHSELLRVFEIYDRKFIEQNEAGDGSLDAETTYAAQRVAAISRIFGRTEQTKTYLQQTIRGLTKLVDEEPDSFGTHLHDLVESNLWLVSLHAQAREPEQAKKRLLAAYNLLNRPDIPDTNDDSLWITLLMRQTATLSMQFGDCRSAVQLANQACRISERFASQRTNDVEWKTSLRECQSLVTNLQVACTENVE